MRNRPPQADLEVASGAVTKLSTKISAQNGHVWKVCASASANTEAGTELAMIGHRRMTFE